MAAVRHGARMAARQSPAHGTPRARRRQPGPCMRAATRPALTQARAPPSQPHAPTQAEPDPGTPATPPMAAEPRPRLPSQAETLFTGSVETTITLMPVTEEEDPSKNTVSDLDYLTVRASLPAQLIAVPPPLRACSPTPCLLAALGAGVGMCTRLPPPRMAQWRAHAHTHTTRARAGAAGHPEQRRPQEHWLLWHAQHGRDAPEARGDPELRVRHGGGCVTARNALESCDMTHMPGPRVRHGGGWWRVTTHNARTTRACALPLCPPLPPPPHTPPPCTLVPLWRLKHVY